MYQKLNQCKSKLILALGYLFIVSNLNLLTIKTVLANNTSTISERIECPEKPLFTQPVVIKTQDYELYGEFEPPTGNETGTGEGTIIYTKDTEGGVKKGDSYTGTFFNGEYEGCGIFRGGKESNIDYYIGRFKGGKAHGIGRLKLKNSSTETCGRWENNNLQSQRKCL